jgi:phosphate transport system substrate-binding protein
MAAVCAWVRWLGMCARVGGLLLAACAMCVLCAIAPAIGAELRIGGAGTTLGTMKELGDAYMKLHPDVKIAVLPSLGAVGGVNALLSGAADLATSTRTLTESERANEVVKHEVARIPFVFAVSSRNNASNVTSAQLLEIYQGKLTAWPDGTRIRLVLRPPSVSDTIFLKDLSADWKKAMLELEAKPGMLVVATAQEAADRVEKTSGAITTSTINLIVTEKRAMKALRVDGVAPTADSITDGSYKYYKPVILVTLPAAPPAVSEFVKFVQSNAGREILIRTGHIPLAAGR